MWGIVGLIDVVSVIYLGGSCFPCIFSANRNEAFKVELTAVLGGGRSSSQSVARHQQKVE